MLKQDEVGTTKQCGDIPLKKEDFLLMIEMCYEIAVGKKMADSELTGLRDVKAIAQLLSISDSIAKCFLYAINKADIFLKSKENENTPNKPFIEKLFNVFDEELKRKYRNAVKNLKEHDKEFVNELLSEEPDKQEKSGQQATRQK